MKRFTLTLFACVLAATSASAAVTDMAVSSVDNSGALSGYTTQDILIDFGGQYTGSQLLIELTSGSIYQDANGSALPPNSGFFGFVPSLEFDTFAAQGSAVSGGAFGEPSLGGGAVDLGGAATATFDSSLINQAWNPAGGTVITDQTGFITARVTLSDDAAGTWSYLASAGGDISTYSGTIESGTIVPEPATMSLLGLGGLAILRRRRKARA